MDAEVGVLQIGEFGSVDRVIVNPANIVAEG